MRRLPLVLVGLVLLPAARAEARVVPDRGFAGAGLAVVRAPLGQSTYAEARAVAAAPDGSALVVGSRIGDGMRVGAVRRYAADGGTVAAFGIDGLAVVRDGRSSVVLEAVAARPDGRIVVVGTSGGVAARPRILMARLLASGRPDPGFGGGDGVATLGRAGERWRVVAAAIDPAGRAVVGIERVDLRGLRGALVRLTATGALDRAFGAAGLVDLGAASATRVAADGSRIALLAAPAGGGAVAGVRLLDAAGRPVAGFGGRSGLAAPVPGATLGAVALIDGAVQVGGLRAGATGFVATLDAAGAVAAVPGVVDVPVPGASLASVSAIAPGPRGSLAVTGIVRRSGGGPDEVLLGTVSAGGVGGGIGVPVAGAFTQGRGVAVLADGSVSIAASGAAFVVVSGDLLPTARAPRVEDMNGATPAAYPLALRLARGRVVVALGGSGAEGPSLALDRHGRLAAGFPQPLAAGAADLIELHAAVDARGGTLALAADFSGTSTLIRRTATGALDRRLDGDGRLVLPAALGTPRRVAIDARGGLLVLLERALPAARHGARIGRELPRAVVVARLDARGRLDRTWGSAGVAAVPRFAEAVAGGGLLVPLPDGRLLVGTTTHRIGSSRDAGQVVRLTRRGRLDPRFAAGGVGAPPGAASLGTLVALVPVPGGGVAGVVEAPGEAAIRAFRLRADGRPLTTFGRRGLVTLRVPGRALVATSLARRADGGLLVALRLSVPRRESAEPTAALLGLRADGRRDRRLGPAGLATLETTPDASTYVAAAGDGSFVLAGTADDAIVVRRLRVR